MTSIAHYNILEPIGIDGIGEMFRARDTKVGRTVAIKIVGPRVAGDPAALARLVEDATIAAKLSHPNIATLWEVGEADGRTYLAYEFVAGRRLREEAGGVAMNPRRALDLAIQIADGVAEAHATGIIHGDLRLDTVMVTAKGSAKIIEFGMSQWTRGGATRTAAAHDPDTLPADAVNVLAYISPEQAIGSAVDTRTDVFSIGAIAYELVTGRSPFAAATPAQTILNVIKAQAPPASEVNPAVPKDLDPILARALAADIALRQQSAAALAAELRTVAAVLDVRTGDAAAPSSLLPIDDTPDKNAAKLLWGGLLAAAAAAGLVWWLLAR
jgi:eukaryotic-like serine/threonine-protein kinase